jgi:hypothetical protein
MGMKIVVWDPKGELLEGQVIEDGLATEALVGRGVVMLPADADLLKVPKIPTAGYYRRGWGSGWLFDGLVGSRGCPMLLFAMSDRMYLHWVVRIAQLEPQGSIRLTTDTGQPTAMSGGLRADGQAVNLAELGEPDADGGWTVRGRSMLNCSGDGYLGLSIYAVARKCLVLWSAVSQSRDP